MGGAASDKSNCPTTRGTTTGEFGIRKTTVPIDARLEDEAKAFWAFSVIHVQKFKAVVFHRNLTFQSHQLPKFCQFARMMCMIVVHLKGKGMFLVGN